MGSTAFKVVSVLVTIAGAAIGIASDKIKDKNMKDEIAKQVAEAVAKKD